MERTDGGGEEEIGAVIPRRLNECILQLVTLQIARMAGSLSLRHGLKTVACGDFGFSPLLRSKLPYARILHAPTFGKIHKKFLLSY